MTDVLEFANSLAESDAGTEIGADGAPGADLDEGLQTGVGAAPDTEADGETDDEQDEAELDDPDDLPAQLQRERAARQKLEADFQRAEASRAQLEARLNQPQQPQAQLTQAETQTAIGLLQREQQVQQARNELAAALRAGTLSQEQRQLAETTLQMHQDDIDGKRNLLKERLEFRQEQMAWQQWARSLEPYGKAAAVDKMAQKYNVGRNADFRAFVNKGQTQAQIEARAEAWAANRQVRQDSQNRQRAQQTVEAERQAPAARRSVPNDAVARQRATIRERSTKGQMSSVDALVAEFRLDERRR